MAPEKLFPIYRLALVWLALLTCPVLMAAPCELTNDTIVELKSPHAVEGKNFFVAFESLSGCLAGFSGETGTLEFQSQIADPKDKVSFVKQNNGNFFILNQTQKRIHLVQLNSRTDLKVTLLLDYNPNSYTTTECAESLVCRIANRFSSEGRQIRKMGFINGYLILMDPNSFVVARLKEDSIVWAQDLTHHWGIFLNLGDLIAFDQHESLLLVDFYDDIPNFEYLHFNDKEEFGGRPFFYRESPSRGFGFIVDKNFVDPDYKRFTENDIDETSGSFKNGSYKASKYDVHPIKRLLANEDGEVINLNPFGKVSQIHFPSSLEDPAVRHIRWGMDNLLYVFENGHYVIYDKYMRKRPWSGHLIEQGEEAFHAGKDTFFKLSSHGRLSEVLTLIDSE